MAVWEGCASPGFLISWGLQWRLAVILIWSLLSARYSPLGVFHVSHLTLKIPRDKKYHHYYLPGLIDKNIEAEGVQVTTIASWARKKGKKIIKNNSWAGIQIQRVKSRASALHHCYVVSWPVVPLAKQVWVGYLLHSAKWCNASCRKGLGHWHCPNPVQSKVHIEFLTPPKLVSWYSPEIDSSTTPSPIAPRMPRSVDVRVPYLKV